MTSEELRARIDAWIGREGEPSVARDAVNPAMIRHWCDAVGDENPVYTDRDFAKKSVHGGIVAPPTMLQAWTMAGLRPPAPESAGPSPLGEVMRLLDAAGYTSVVATNCRQEYRRYVREGDLLSVATRIAKVSDEKKTALGLGRFIDEEMIYRDASGEEVARMTFRILKFKPPTASHADAAPTTAVRRGDARAPRSRTTTPSSGKASRPASCGSSAAPAAARCAIRPARCARTASRSTGTRSSRPGAATCSASWWPTTRRCRRSRIRMRSR
jgi:acyl dehydratase